jgi:dTDP-4-dehydrorhamnose reductase
MNVLIIGVTGMLGHKLYQVLRPDFDVTGTIRGKFEDISRFDIFQRSEIVAGVDVMNVSSVELAISNARPDAVVNCAGVVKSLVPSSGMVAVVQLNSLFPHQLYQLCRARNIRLVQVSTDCVFSGTKGMYKEDDTSDAEDIYGKTKFIGEVNEPNALTIRTSMIGRELSSANGLVEWFLSNEGRTVQGYTNAIFSGFPTLHLSRIIADIIKNQKPRDGLYNVSSEPIDKYRLLTLIKKAMGLNITIEKYPGYRIDRSLDSTKFREETGFVPLSWETMVDEFVQDAKRYPEWR